MKKLKVRITLTEELLGTASANPDIHREFIASKSPDARTIEDEVASVGAEAVADKAMTVFSRDKSGNPILWDYQLKGFFKDSCGSLARVSDSKSAKLKAFRKVIDGTVFVFPREIKLNLPNGGEIGNCQRPLRAQTAQGERIALANSETVPAGTFIDVEIHLLSDTTEAVAREWLDYGLLRGLGQWRNSGKGRFSWAEIE